jgi:hypothetical protein
MRALNDPGVDAAGAQYYAPANGTWVQRAYDRLRRHRPGDHRSDGCPAATSSFVARPSSGWADSMRRLKPAKTSICASA